MKLALIAGAATVLASALTGCVVAPYEPVVYAVPPPPPPMVVVRPAYGHHYHHGHRWHGRRGWR